MIIAVAGSRLLGPFGLDAQGRRSPKRLGEVGFGTYGPHPGANDLVSGAAPLNSTTLILPCSWSPPARESSGFSSTPIRPFNWSWPAEPTASRCSDSTNQEALVPTGVALRPFGAPTHCSTLGG